MGTKSNKKSRTVSETKKETKPVNTVDNLYKKLRYVFTRAEDQASVVGAMKHARDGQKFEEQPIVDITRRLRVLGLGFPLGQAEKKIEEAALVMSKLYTNEMEFIPQMDCIDKTEIELLGAINFLAAAVIRIDEIRDAIIKERE